MCFAQGMQTSYVNIALKKPTWQSSLYRSYWTSNLAVDGNKNATAVANSCAHMNISNAPSWWAVDLGSLTRVFGVNLTNRGDCCGELFFLSLNMVT
jgi:F5/8 type C domain